MRGWQSSSSGNQVSIKQEAEQGMVIHTYEVLGPEFEESKGRSVNV
jgi:hypothetical protein